MDEIPHHAELISRRALTVCVSLSVLGTFAGIVFARSTSPVAAVPVWYMAPVMATLAVLILAGPIAMWLPLTALRVVSGIGAALYVVVLAAFGPTLALLDPGAVTGVLPWALAVYAGPSLAAVVAAGESAGLIVAAASLCAVPIYRMVLSADDSLGPAVSDVQTALCALSVCVIGGALVRGAVRVDALAGRAGAATAREAEIRGQVAARARAAAFVHDEVLVTLRAAAEGGASTRAALQRQARRALELADRFRSGTADVEAGEAAAWLEDLHGYARALDPGIRIDVSETPHGLSVPVGVAQALVGATRQAVDNSVRHAGPATRVIRLERGPDRILVEVWDDGAGFDPAALPPGRLGIGMSIIAAMQAVGGQARIDSAPGSGTRVVLEWQPGAIPEDDVRDIERRDLPTAVHAFEDARFTRGVRALVALFFVSQAVVAGIVGFSTDSAPVSFGVLTALALSGYLIVRVRGRGPVAAALVTAVPVAAGFGGIALASGPVSYAQAWFVPAIGLVLGAVALLLRPMAAVAGMVGLLAGVIVISQGAGSESIALALAAARTTLIVTLAILMALVIRRARHLSVTASERAVSAIRARARDAAAQREIERRASDLDAYARPLLERLAAGEHLSDADRSFARAVEGRLRDGYRAQALSREPLTQAVMQARTRGVDVVLLDDSGQAQHDDAVADAVADWMAPHVHQARERFVGRLLPPGRALIARAVVDGRTAGYPPAGESGTPGSGPSRPTVQGASRGRQGE